MKDGRRMANDGNGGERFDETIDRAVREMLDVEPSADLRARVLVRIEAGSVQTPASSFQLPALRFGRFAAMSAAAALAVLVLVLVLARRVEPPVPAPVVARTGGQPPAGARQSAPPTVHQETPTDTPDPRASAHVAFATRAGAIAAATTASERTAGVEPLNAITPIEVAPIAHGSIAPDPIAVRPLTPITELQIAPLNPPDGRN